MQLYFQSNPSASGYRKRLHLLWRREALPTATEGQLASQARSIRKGLAGSGHLTDAELMELSVLHTPASTDPPKHKPKKKSAPAPRQASPPRAGVPSTHAGPPPSPIARQEQTVQERQDAEATGEPPTSTEDELPSLTQALAALRAEVSQEAAGTPLVTPHPDHLSDPVEAASPSLSQAISVLRRGLGVH